MVKPNLILVLGDQLTLDLAAIKRADKSKDIIIMAEADAEAEYVKHHPKKIAFIFSAMRHFADTLNASGWKVLYSKIDDPQNSHNIIGEILRYAEKVEANEVFVTKPGEWRLIVKGEFDLANNPSDLSWGAAPRSIETLILDLPPS